MKRVRHVRVLDAATEKIQNSAWAFRLKQQALLSFIGWKSTWIVGLSHREIRRTFQKVSALGFYWDLQGELVREGFCPAREKYHVSKCCFSNWVIIASVKLTWQLDSLILGTTHQEATSLAKLLVKTYKTEKVSLAISCIYGKQKHTSSSGWASQ